MEFSMEPSETNNLIRALSQPLYQSRGWMKLIGVMMILYGTLFALTIVGIIFAWLPIWLGILLFQAASSAEDAHIASNAEELLATQRILKTYFTIMGVITLISLLFGLLGLFMGMGGMIIHGTGQMGWWM